MFGCGRMARLVGAAVLCAMATGAWADAAAVAETAEADPTVPIPADTVVYGTIRTAEEGNPVAEALAVKDGKYVYVGDGAGVAAYIQDGVTEVIDHRGKGMVMPGCTDGHSHYTMQSGLANMKGGVLFDMSDDKAAVLRKVETAALAAQKAGKTCVFGFGWNLVTLRVRGVPPTLKELDDATHGLSLVIFAQGGHHAYCNSECLKRCGIIDGRGNVLITKIDGGLLELDEKGYPTGFADERVTGYLTRMGGINADELVDDEVAETSILASRKLLLSTGYTIALEGWSNMLHPSKFYEAANRLDKSGDLTLVFPMTYEVEPWQTNMTEQIECLARLNATYGTGHVLPEYLKVFMDGCVESMTGAMTKPYKNGTDYKSFWPTNRLADITRACNAKGLTVHTHVMGDAAVRDVTDAYVQGGDGTHRNCMVHLRHVRKEDFRRFADNNIACSAGFTWHVASADQDELLKTFLDDEYVYHAYPMKSFLDAGVKVSSHSDFPANAPSPQDPFGIMQVAVTGMVPNPAEGDRPHDTNELVAVEQVFQALTINGAWQLGLENERGSIKLGKWADFVLADRDVFGCAATEIGKTKVVSTWFEGEQVYPAPEPPKPEGLSATGTVKYPKPVKNTPYLKAKSSATWTAKPDAGCVFAGWMPLDGAKIPVAYGLLSANENKSPTLKLEIAEDETDILTNFVVATWTRIDEDRLGEVTLTPTTLVAESKSHVTATVSGLPSGLKFNKKTLAIESGGKKTPKDASDKKVKVSVKNASGYTFRQSFLVTVGGGEITKVVPADDEVRTGEPVMLWGDAALGKVKGAKVCVAGKKASVRATPAKGSVFLGWYEDPAFKNAATNLPKGCLTASQSVVVPADGGLRLFARFVELQPWTVGTFDGVHYETVGGTNVEGGTVTIAVGSNGKVSGKTRAGGKSFSFSAKALDDAVETDCGDIVFVAHPTMKVGGEVETLTLYIYENTETGFGAAEVLYGEGDDAPIALAVQNGWKLKPVVLPAFPTGKAALTCEAPMGIGLTLKFGSKGTVTAKGVVPGDDLNPVSASAAAQVLPAAWTDVGRTNLISQTCVYVAPKKNLAEGFCKVYDLLLKAEETGTEIEAVKILSAEEYAEHPITGVVRCLPGRDCRRAR